MCYKPSQKSVSYVDDLLVVLSEQGEALRRLVCDYSGPPQVVGVERPLPEDLVLPEDGHALGVGDVDAHFSLEKHVHAVAHVSLAHDYR